jgi:hypothetical protein
VGVDLEVLSSFPPTTAVRFTMRSGFFTETGTEENEPRAFTSRSDGQRIFEGRQVIHDRRRLRSRTSVHAIVVLAAKIPIAGLLVHDDRSFLDGRSR